jgi:hypothetical protein
MQCLPGNSKIICKTNRKRYDKNEIIPGAKDIKDINIGDEVLTYNEKTGEKEFKKVKTVMNRFAEESIIITFSNCNEIELTSEHPVAVDNEGFIKWMKAGEIGIGERVLQYNYMGLPFRLHSLWRNGKSYEDIYGKDDGDKLRRKIGDDTLERWSKSDSYLRFSDSKAKHHDTLISLNVDDEYKKNRMRGLAEWSAYATDETAVELFGQEVADAMSKITSERMKKKWKTNKHEILQGMAQKPTSLEIDFGLLMNCNFPNQWKYVGNNKLLIGNGKLRCPDFAHITMKKLVEVFHD